MSTAIVQTAQRAVGNQPVVLAYATNPTVGNLLVACVLGNNGGGPATNTLTSTNNTWVSAVSISDSNYAANNEIFYAKNCAGGADTVTLAVTESGTPEGDVLVLYEVSGCDTVSPLVATNSAKANSGAASGGNVTTTVANSFVVANIEVITGTISAGSGWTINTSGGGVLTTVTTATESRLPTSTGTFAGDFGGTFTFWNITVAAFQEAASAAPFPVAYLMSQALQRAATY